MCVCVYVTTVTAIQQKFPHVHVAAGARRDLWRRCLPMWHLTRFLDKLDKWLTHAKKKKRAERGLASRRVVGQRK